MISAIVAVDNNWGIGFNGELLEHNPVDMKRFKHLTETNIVICGRKTWESIPNRPLPRRLAIVITNKGFKVEPGAIFLDMHHAMAHIKAVKDDNAMEWFVIGGGEIYKQLLPYCDRVYVTKFYKDHKNVDTYFPDLDLSTEWEITQSTMKQTHNNVPYQFLTYDRIS